MSEREGLSEARGGGGGSWTIDLKTPPSPRTFTQSKGKQEGRNDAWMYEIKKKISWTKWEVGEGLGGEMHS